MEMSGVSRHVCHRHGNDYSDVIIAERMRGLNKTPPAGLATGATLNERPLSLPDYITLQSRVVFP